MQQIHIRVRSFWDLHELVALAADKPYSVQLTDGHCTACAKRFLSVSSLDLSRVLTLTLECDDGEAAAFCRQCAHLVEE